MPHFRISGLDAKQVQFLSGTLSEDLSRALDCPIDWVTFSCTAPTLFCNGEVFTGTVFVHVEWFDRGEGVRDTVASILTDGILQKSKIQFITPPSIDVIFVDLKKENYYENGNHY